MSKDIFLSYASRDADRIEKIAAALEQSGFSVWWDREIPPGKTWDAVLGKALNEAKCVLVFWTGHSVKSDWVKDEAARGKSRKILVPALLEDVDIPLGFGRIEAADLRHWDGDINDYEFVNFIQAIRNTIDQEDHTTAEKPVTVNSSEYKPGVPSSSPSRFRIWYLLFPLLLLIIPVLAYKLFYTDVTHLVTELWSVESDRKSSLLAANSFKKGAHMDAVEEWLISELKLIKPAEKKPIKVNLQVPADLKSEAVQYSTEPPITLDTYIYVVSGSSKARIKTPLTQKRLALMEEDFYIEFRHTGYMSEVIKIKIGNAKSKTFELKPKKIAVAVEHFENDKKNLATRLSRRLSSYDMIKVTTPDALKVLRDELTHTGASVRMNRAVQTAIRDSLGVDYIVSGSLEIE